MAGLLPLMGVWRGDAGVEPYGGRRRNSGCAEPITCRADVILAPPLLRAPPPAISDISSGGKEGGSAVGSRGMTSFDMAVGEGCA